MTTAELYERFRDPGPEYRIQPLFRVNDEIDREEVRFQLASMKRQGLGGVFAISEVFRNQAPEKFVSPWWWKVVRWIAEACVENGLEFWVYDDEDWPSGSIGGKLMEDHPERNWKYLSKEEHPVAAGGTLRLSLDPATLVGVNAFRLEGDTVVPGSVRDLTAEVRNGALAWRAPGAGWTVLSCTAHAGRGFFIPVYGDLMSRDAMAAFVDQVYRAHYDELAAMPGLAFKGYFTDEPAFSYAMIKWADQFPWYPAMPWTPELPEAFERRHGYPWRENLPLLYRASDHRSLRFRMHHWETCWHLYHENYFGQIYRFCEQRGLKASGHLVVEESFYNHLAQQAGNLPGHFRYMHVPGIDWIAPFEHFQHLPSTTPKYATSMAHLAGRERTWCESFAASGWGLSFQSMLRITNWEHVNGINMQIPICYKYSLRGPDRTTFYNPGLGYQQPYWQHFRAFADTEARACVLAAGADHVAQILLAYPEVDIWAHCWDHELLEERSRDYNRLGDLLRASGYDYDVLDDRAILESTLDGGTIATQTERFPVLVVPRCDAVRRAFLDRCRRFAESGGRLLFVGGLPRHSFEHGSDDPAVDDLVSRLLGRSARRLAGEGKAWEERRGSGIAGFVPDAEAALATLSRWIAPDLRLPPGETDIYAYHRRLGDGDLYLLYNHTDRGRTVRLSLAARGSCERWSTRTGGREPVAEARTIGDVTTLTVAFAPRELVPILLTTSGRTLPPVARVLSVRELPVPGPFAFSIEETMRQPHVAWNFTQEADGWHTKAAPRVVPTTMPLGDWCGHGLRYFSGIGIYETDVDLGALPQGCRVVLDLGSVAQSAEVSVNGSAVGVAAFAPWTVDITARAVPGRNRLRVAVANTLANYYSQFAELEGKDYGNGGWKPEQTVSGLLGPVVVRITRFA